MAIIKFEELQLIRTNGKPYKIPKKIYHLQCDNQNCKKEYTVDRVRGKYQFCSNACKADAFKKGGLLEVYEKEIVKAKYGVEYASQSEQIKEQRKQTSQRNWGTDYPSQSPIVKNKIKQANRDSFGADSYFQSEGYWEKYEQIMIEKYGDKTPINNPKIKQKRINTLLDKYGVDSPMRAEQFKKKKEETCIKRYGVPNAMMRDDFKQKSFENRMSIAKMDNTKPRSKSKLEMEFYQKLCDYYGKENIRQDNFFRGRDIDIFIVPLKAWICFDGTYYHGLDVDEETLNARTNPQGKNICKVFYMDREQDEIFKSWHMPLIRITDKQYKSTPFIDLIEIIENTVQNIKNEYNSIPFESLDELVYDDLYIETQDS